MTAQLETLEREVELHPEPVLAAPRLFPAVPAGVATGIALLALLQFLGRGLGIVSPPGESGYLTFGSIVWWLIVVMPASTAAGILAGALAHPTGTVFAVALGLITWAGGMVLMSVLLGIGAGNLLGGVPGFLSGYARFPSEVRYGEFTAGAAWVVLASALLGLASSVVGTMIGSRSKA